MSSSPAPVSQPSSPARTRPRPPPLVVSGAVGVHAASAAAAPPAEDRDLVNFPIVEWRDYVRDSLPVRPRFSSPLVSFLSNLLLYPPLRVFDMHAKFQSSTLSAAPAAPTFVQSFLFFCHACVLA